MKLGRLVTSSGREHVGIIGDGSVQLLNLATADHCRCLADILYAADPVALARSLVDQNSAALSLSDVRLLAPVDHQEVWAAGVTYKRSQVARMQESETGASHYDRVYTADRPELFFKSLPSAVVGPGETIRVRFDSNWSVPEPEFTLVIAPDLRLVGYTIGNDVSARDIEGENPLYLPQAKVYRQSCAIGPWVVVPEQPLDRAGTNIVLTITRGGDQAFRGETDLAQMARTFENLIDWLGRENEFPQGALLLTGTGIIPPDEFTLEDGDSVTIEITGIGTLTNPVVKNAK